MAGKRKRPDWTSPRQSDRVRKMVAITLSDEAREKLERLGERYGGKSAAVERLIMEAEEPG